MKMKKIVLTFIFVLSAMIALPSMAQTTKTTEKKECPKTECSKPCKKDGKEVTKKSPKTKDSKATTTKEAKATKESAKPVKK